MQSNTISLANKIAPSEKIKLNIHRQGGEQKEVSEVRLGENESIDSALRRFKKKIQKAGILSEVKRRERYEKPSLRRKRKAEASRKRRY